MFYTEKDRQDCKHHHSLAVDRKDYSNVSASENISMLHSLNISFFVDSPVLQL